MTTCPGFSELVKCEADGDYTIAWGWTQSTGQGGSYPYTPPTGWKFDSRYSDERGGQGSHGGCNACIMTLVHLITMQSDSAPTPEPTPTAFLTSGTVIDNITRAGDVGEPGYSVYGQTLRKCTYSGSKDDWHGATQDGLSAVLPTCYITESVYSFLTDGEIESVRSRLQGIVPNSYAHKVRECPDSGKCYYCWEFLPNIEARPVPTPDPCEGVTCEDECDNTNNLYETVCEDGICVRGRLIESDSQTCGYVPPEPPEPEPSTPWDVIILVIVAVILFYMLTMVGS